MAELKPCPFCGNRDVGISGVLPQFGEEMHYKVICFNCNAQTRVCAKRDNAIKAWNRRAEDGR